MGLIERIAVGAISEKPQRAPEAEAWMTGKELTRDNMDKMIQKTAGSLKIIPHHGYSKHYLTECLKMQLQQAFDDAIKTSTESD